ncbi:septum site-determining protein Ssd [Arthrobacter sp. NPDC089319]|uniref:septum site-determining protein Ssd n=1 Tax=Arthrobacter sp. NPDC089319 TaxID=3155915 RepID=UPI003433CBD4
MPRHHTVNGRMPWRPAEATDVVLLGGTDRLRDEIARIAAAAGLALRAEPPRDAPVAAAGATPVLLGTGYARVPRTTAEVIVVGFIDEAPALWDLAASTGAGRVAVLPDGAAWLAEYLSRTRRRETAGKLVAVHGASGGVGTSALAGWLAATAAQSGTATVLVDGDPLGGGLSSALGAADVPGLVWPDLAEVQGTVNPVQLAASLPAIAGFSLLSWPGTGEANLPEMPAVETAAAVMAAASGAFALVVIDAGRLRTGREVGPPADDIVVLTRADCRSRRAAASAVRAAAGTGATVHVVVRGPLPAGTDEQLIADGLGAPLAGYLPHLRAVPAGQRDGRLPEFASNRRIRSLCASLLERLEIGHTSGRRP